MEEKYFIIDFDSTFTQVEALDVLAHISLQNNPEKEQRLQAIHQITNQGMEGTLPLKRSIQERINLLKANRSHLDQLVTTLEEKVSRSFKRNKSFFQTHAQQIFIISNGFKDFIEPVVSPYGILSTHIFANTFVFDEQGNIIDFDQQNILASNQGKAKQIKRLNLKGDIYVIGDGYTDYEIKAAGLANKFYAFTENVSREKVVEKAEAVAPSFDDFLYQEKMNTNISYPKNRIKALILENIHPHAEAIFKEEGYQVEIVPSSLNEEELCKKIEDTSIIAIRSKTTLTPKVLSHAHRLIAIGAYCIGTNQIDLVTAQKSGIATFNAPYSNTRSVVELAIGNIIMLIRSLPDKIQKMHQGQWQKSAQNSFEIRGKKLGIIGYGNIGAQLSVLAENLGLDVYFYDIDEKLALGNATPCGSLEELLKIADIVTLHVDGRPENENLISHREFELMKSGTIFLNLSRGFVVDVEALKYHVLQGKIRGTAIDVFPHEPKDNQESFHSPLQNLPNTILTPHIGGSTLEAQENIAQFVSQKIIQYINTGSTTHSVNFPNLQLPALEHAHRLIHIHHNMPGILAKINRVLADYDINITGQYLKTNEQIGYVITDIDKVYSKEVIKALKKIEHTIRFRILY